MDAEVTLFTKPEELIAWADTFDILLNPSIEDAAILLKLHFMFGNRTLTYVSTEGEPAIKQLEAEQNEQVKKKGRKAEPETVTADSAVKKQEEFEAMKKKTRNMLLGLVAVIVAAVAGIAAYKAMH